eukprot:EG_transcript_9894
MRPLAWLLCGAVLGLTHLAVLRRPTEPATVANPVGAPVAEVLTQDTAAAQVAAPTSGQEEEEYHRIERLWTSQRELLGLLPIGRRSTAYWAAYYARLDAPAPTATDVAIHRQLRRRALCSNLSRGAPWGPGELLAGLRRFVKDVYPNRPIKDNRLGMGFNHAFLAWLYADHLRPDVIVENGVHKGQSTWLLRQASPNATILSFDPNADLITHWDPNVTYFVGGPAFRKPGFRVRPFVDFGEVAWSELVPDRRHALVLFDDHQNHLKRLQQLQANGFRYAMFDDNWPELQGDNLSLKQVCDETGGRALRDPAFADTRVLVMDNFHMADHFISLAQHLNNRRWLHSVVETYFEGPPPLFHPRHLEFTKFGHKPKKDRSAVPLVLPRPSNRLLNYFAHTLIPRPIVTTRRELDFVGLADPVAGLTQEDFGGHGCPCYVVLREAAVAGRG